MAGNELVDDLELTSDRELKHDITEERAALRSLEKLGTDVKQVDLSSQALSQSQAILPPSLKSVERKRLLSNQSTLMSNAPAPSSQASSERSITDLIMENKKLKLQHMRSHTPAYTNGSSSVVEHADVLRGNKFALLADLNILSEAENSAVITNTINANSPPLANRGQFTEAQTTSTTKKMAFCPPIILFKANVSHLIKYLREKSPPIEFKFVKVNKNKTKLLLKDIEIHKEFMTVLKNQKYDSYSFTPKEEKRVNLILIGLHSHVKPEDIKIELNNLLPNTVEEVTKFTTSYSKKIKSAILCKVLSLCQRMML